MVASIQQLIATVNPDLYYDHGGDKKKLEEFKNKIKTLGFQKAAEEAKAKPLTYVTSGDFFKISNEGNEATHKLIYDSTSDTLEPIYFFILDLMNDFGLDPKKFVDNFSSSPGSGHFSELSQRATILQQQATKTLGDVNVVLRSVLNTVYDLKELRTRLKTYELLDSKEGGEKQGALLSLKQIWIDKVDILKGNSSIKVLALSQAGYQSLIDSFLVVESEKDVEKLDLNERVRRILLPRIQDFTIWLKESEKELRSRYNIEKTYLRSQVNSLKMYSHWVKPYLLAAQKLEMKESGTAPELVNVFNTILLELTLFGKSKIDPKKVALEGGFPKEFANDKFVKTFKRDYYACVLVEFRFRGIPQKISSPQSHYSFGGRSEVNFTAYALNSEEIDKLEEEIKNSEVSDVLSLIKGITEESLDTLKADIDFFLEEDKKEKNNEKEKDSSNPFLALFGKYEKKETPKKEEVKVSPKKKEITISSEDFIEKTHLRPYSAKIAQENAFNLFDIYKKSHGMASYT